MIFIGFISDIMNVQKELNPPEERTQAFFSATMPNEVQKIAAECLNKYIFLVIGIVGAANKNVDQKFYRCEDKKQKFKIVRHSYIFDRPLSVVWTVYFYRTRNRPLTLDP